MGEWGGEGGKNSHFMYTTTAARPETLVLLAMPKHGLPAFIFSSDENGGIHSLPRILPYKINFIFLLFMRRGDGWMDGWVNA